MLITESNFNRHPAPCRLPCSDPRHSHEGWYNLSEHLKMQKVNDQASSPLFRRFPAEVRNLIFQHFLTKRQARVGLFYHEPNIQPNHDEPPSLASEFRTELIYYDSDVMENFRPDYDYELLRKEGLLFTRRRVHLEACSLRLLLAEIAFVGGRRYAYSKSPSERFQNPAPIPGLQQYHLV
ncbi:hypothetical protein F5Y15DRAFT_208619 [Xylariaceae sp. FL0016]|nr:hypothetical protein F5Y15DRAFT_208619 [Xylariaceae sp. FL0016]